MIAKNFYLVFNLLLTSFITAGGLGFINYYILEKIDIIRQRKDYKDEKILLILFFSIINYAIFLLVFNFPKNEVLIQPFILNISIGIFKTLGVSIFISFTIYPFIANLLSLVISFFRNYIMKIPKTSNKTPKERLFSVNQAFTYVYIFDFAKSKIGEGYLDGWTNDEDVTTQISLTPPDSPSDLSFNDALNWICEEDNENNYSDKYRPTHLIDYDNKVHYFISYKPIIS